MISHDRIVGPILQAFRSGIGASGVRAHRRELAGSSLTTGFRRARRRVVHALAACVLVAPATTAQVVQSGAGSVASVVRAASPAIVTIHAIDAQGSRFALGSGFIAADGRVVTNAHVVSGAAVAEVVGADGSTLERANFAEAMDEQADIAVLPRVRSTIHGLELAASLPSPGDHIVVIGAPEGLSNTVSDGIVSAARRLGGQSLLHISAPISHGSSGGPVLDMVGQVVGIATSFLSEGQNLNFAVPAGAIRTLMDAAPARLRFPRGESSATPTRTSAPAGASAQCRDGTYSFSSHRRGTCSHHGGVATWLLTVPPS
jgi:S1-C subfamily serine protease